VLLVNSQEVQGSGHFRLDAGREDREKREDRRMGERERERETEEDTVVEGSIVWGSLPVPVCLLHDTNADICRRVHTTDRAACA
jgi:hypothetical protein